jgi:O-methyltransferase
MVVRSLPTSDAFAEEKNMQVSTRLKSLVRSAVRKAGYELVPAYVCPSGFKIYDFRKEPGFSEVADRVLQEGKTLLGHNRLLVLWQAIRNTAHVSGSVAEIGTYRGGSARFIALGLEHFRVNAPLHVFDTFEGHPDVIPALDALQRPGMFADTSLAAVTEYLSPHSNLQIHQGAFPVGSETVADQQFRLVHIDTDLYQPTLDGLSFFWPRLARGGTVVIDDYGFTSCTGVRQAAGEFLAGQDAYQSWYMHTGQFVLQKAA